MDFKHLHQKFFDSYQKRYTFIVAGWRDIRESRELTALDKIQFETHALKGESGALGFNQLYELVKQLDDEIRTIQQGAFTPSSIKAIDQILNQLIAAHKLAPNPLLVHPDSDQASEIVEVESVEADSKFHIALIDDQESVGQSMTKLLRSFGFLATYFSSISEYKQAQSSHSFSLILLDIVMPDVNQEQVFEFARECIDTGTNVIAVSSKDDLHTRLMAVRAGVNDYALKPINVNILISKIRRVCALDIERPYKIVLLDDQETIGEYFKGIAKQKGFELVSFSNAKSFIRNLDVSIPDVFLLDVNMPDVNGLEVAQILRHESRFEYVPIIFLSADDSRATKLDILSAGGEDIISKNDPPEHIFKQLEYRINRGQHIRSMAVKDGLTGLLNHGQLMESLSGLKRLAERMNTFYGVALIDLDRFKLVNDTYGHATGDTVLVGLSQLVKRHVREVDIVGRYGGEEFLIAFQNVTDKQRIVSKLNEIRESFAAVEFSTPKGSISVTFSCGFSLSKPGQSLADLIYLADQAMYKAKHLGRNRVEVN